MHLLELKNIQAASRFINFQISLTVHTSLSAINERKPVNKNCEYNEDRKRIRKIQNGTCYIILHFSMFLL